MKLDICVVSWFPCVFFLENENSNCFIYSTSTVLVSLLVCWVFLCIADQCKLYSFNFELCNFGLSEWLIASRCSMSQCVQLLFMVVMQYTINFVFTLHEKMYVFGNLCFPYLIWYNQLSSPNVATHPYVMIRKPLLECSKQAEGLCYLHWHKMI